jgi:hypothetical protein
MGDWIMRKFLTAAAAVLAIGAAAVATAADAHPGWGGGPHPGYGYGHAGYGYGPGYGHGGYWGHPVGGFFFVPPPAYFIGADYYGFYDGCHSHWRWDGYAGQYVRVEACY